MFKLRSIPLVILGALWALLMTSRNSFSFEFFQGYEWPDSALEVPYYINPSGAPSGAVDAIQDAFQTWEEVSNSYVGFNYEGTTSRSDPYVVDGYNDLTFGYAYGALAVTFPWPNDTSEPLEEVDTVFEESENWDTSGSPGPDEYDLQTTAVHEAGHWLLLDDLYDDSDANKVMYGYQDYGEVKRTLHQDDIDGAVYLYPEHITPALNAAYNNGISVLYITSRTYNEDVTMVADVDLIGTGSSTITGTVNFINLTYNAPKIEGFNISTAYPKAGIYIQNSDPRIFKNNVRSTGYIAIRCYLYSDAALDSTRVYNSTHGVYASDYSDPKIFRSTGPNNIVNNSTGVHCRSSSEPDLGVNGVHPGDNNFDNQSYDVYAYTDAALLIKAESNYWGENPPNSSEIYHANPNGVIDYDPYDTTPNAKPAVSGDNTYIAKTLYDWGTEAYYQGRYEEAIGHAKIVVEDYPETEFAPHALARIFRSYKMMGRLAEVYPYLEVTADTSPYTELARVALELSIKRFLDEGDFTKARARADQIITMFSDEKERNDSLRFLICWTYEASGEMEKARQAYAAFVQDYPVTREDGTVRDFSVLAMTKLGLEPPMGEGGATQRSESVVFLQSTPNPFNPQTTLSFALPEAMRVRLVVYNLLGQEVLVLVDGVQSPGIHMVLWDGRDAQGIAVGSGLYFARLEADGTLHTRKLLLVR